MPGEYKDFEPQQYADFEALDERAVAIDLRAVLPDEAYLTLMTQAKRVCLGANFLRREALVYLELPEDHSARRLPMPEYIEERMIDQMSGEYPRSAI